MKKSIYCLLACMVLMTSLFAQSNIQLAAKPGKAAGQGMIAGKVLEENSSTPIEYASVVLLSKPNNQMVSGIASDKNGDFMLRDLPNGSYDLTITFIGFKKKMISDLKVTDESPFINLKEIKMQSDAVQLKESEVVGERSPVEFRIDKKVVNVNQNLSAAGGTAVDVLQNQPSIQVDANGNVTLRGNGNFTVMVDGKPSVLQGTDALRQIPANIIDNIELITNPSAKYDAEGTAGIINIVTKKTNLTSTSGIVNSGIGSRDKYNGDFNIGYRSGDLNFTVGGDARRYSNIQNISIYRLFDNLSDINSDADVHQKRDMYTARFGIDKNFGDKSVLGINGAYGYQDVVAGVYTYNNTAALTGPQTSSVTFSKNSTTVEYFNGSINFTQTFVPKVNNLYFEATLTKLRLPSEQYTAESIDNIVNGTNSKITQNLLNGTSRIDSRIKLNYSHKFSDKNVFETGLQTNLFFKDMNISNEVLNPVTNVWDIDQLHSSKYDFRNNIYAGFATYSNSMLGFDYQAGLRLEYTDRLLSQLSTNQDFKYSKLHLFPTLNISSKISDDLQAQLSYSRRIQRPFDSQLNPSPYFSDSYTSLGGNPELRPSLTHSLELNFQKSFTGVFLTLQTYLRSTTDGTEQVQRVDDQGRIYLTFMNVLNSTSIGAEISSNITIAPWFKLDPAINLYNFRLDENKQYGVKQQNNFAWDMRVNTTFMLSAATRIQFYTNYYAKNVTSQGDIKSFMIIGATVRQEFFERQLIATLSAQNLFGATKFEIISKGLGFDSRLYVLPESPIFNLTLSYNFNNFKRRSTEQVDVNVNTGF